MEKSFITSSQGLNANPLHPMGATSNNRTTATKHTAAKEDQ